MKILSWNVNGIRAVDKKGALDEVLQKYDPDIFFFQETKARSEQLREELMAHPGYYQFYHSAQKPGYAGTAVWVKKETISEVSFFTGMSDFEDIEGRISQIQFDDWAMLGVYFPNGGKSPEAWEGKLQFYDDFLRAVSDLRSAGKRVIFTGDINCCHEAIDIARPKENDGNIGFHPLERAAISRWIEAGFLDVWREKNPNLSGVYSWWSYRGGARDRNVGWRIDSFFVDAPLLSQVKNMQYLTDQKGSDHCPILLEMKD